MGKYLAWLVGAGFLPSPSVSAPDKMLPLLPNGPAIKAAGRSGV
jgi:L-aminoadipate-semialdehyde dehydrogenase